MLKTASIAVVASLLTTVGVLMAFPHFMRPQPARYRYEHDGPASILVRIDEQTGEADELFSSGWHKCAPDVPVQLAAPVLRQRDVFDDAADEMARKEAASQP